MDTNCSESARTPRTTAGESLVTTPGINLEMDTSKLPGSPRPGPHSPRMDVRRLLEVLVKVLEFAALGLCLAGVSWWWLLAVLALVVEVVLLGLR